MKIKNAACVILFLIFTLSPCYASSNAIKKIQKGTDIYFKITDRLQLSFSQQRKALGIKMEEMFCLAPLMEDIARNEAKMQQLIRSDDDNKEEEIEKLDNLIKEQKAAASKIKRQYIISYRNILTQEQNMLLDELIFDIANGYFKI